QRGRHLLLTRQHAALAEARQVVQTATRRATWMVCGARLLQVYCIYNILKARTEERSSSIITNTCRPDDVENFPGRVNCRA
ncbi:unnamed protein product, partial [Amoebophrya sp. A25]